MKATIWCALLMVVLCVFPCAHPVGANSLSEAYWGCFTNPGGFDSYLNDQFVLNQQYFNQIRTCAQITHPAINAVEQQLQAQHSHCPNNAVCTQLANDIQNIRDLRANVNMLVDYIGVADQNPQVTMSNYPIGRKCRQVYNFHVQSGIRVEDNPTLRQQVNMLHSLVCP